MTRSDVRARLVHRYPAALSASNSPYESFFFFFQAEDGIRDGHVTGVQTCALPISRCCTFNRRGSGRCGASDAPSDTLEQRMSRSEERRVGKEGRAGGLAYSEKEKEREAVGVRAVEVDEVGI